MEFTEKGLILKVGLFREADLWVRFFSPSRGLLTGFAFGGAVSRRRFSGCLDGLNEVLLSARSEKRGAYLTLTEGTLLFSPRNLREQGGHLGMAVNCMKFLEAVAVSQESARPSFELAVKSIAALDENAGSDHISLGSGRGAGRDSGQVATISDASVRRLSLFPLLFRARLAMEQGFLPDVTRCAACGKELTPDVKKTDSSCAAEDAPVAYFHVESGALSCLACAGAGRSVRGLPLCAGVLAGLDYVRREDPGRWPRLRLTGTTSRQLGRMVEDFVRYHLGLAWEGNRFRSV